MFINITLLFSYWRCFTFSPPASNLLHISLSLIRCVLRHAHIENAAQWVSFTWVALNAYDMRYASLAVPRVLHKANGQQMGIPLSLYFLFFHSLSLFPFLLRIHFHTSHPFVCSYYIHLCKGSPNWCDLLCCVTWITFVAAIQIE